MGLVVEESFKVSPILWGAPTYDQVRIGWEETRKALGGIADFNQSQMRVTMPSGGVVFFRSLDDPDNARGHSAAGVAVDEIGDVNPIAYYEVLRPMLIDTNGWFWGMGTPKGRNWFFQEFVKAKERADSRAFHAPTLGCEIVDGRLIRKPHPLENPSIPFAEIESLFASMTERSFRQEILAEFIEGQGAVFRNVRAVCTLTTPDKPEQHAGHSFVMGVDWGKSNDYTRLRVLCRDCRKMVDWDGFNKIDYHFQRDRLKLLADRWPNVRSIAEENSIGVPNIEEMRRDGLVVMPFNMSGTSKPPLIEALSLAIEQGNVQLPKEDADELEAFEVRINPNNNHPSYSAPQGMHDDRVIADALTVFGLNRPYGAALIGFPLASVEE